MCINMVMLLPGGGVIFFPPAAPSILKGLSIKMIIMVLQYPLHLRKAYSAIIYQDIDVIWSYRPALPQTSQPLLFISMTVIGNPTHYYESSSIR